MLDKKLKEALELLGGRAVISEPEGYYVLLSLKEFKKIKQDDFSGLTKQELIDKINNDIASWKFAQEESKIEDLAEEELGKLSEEEIVYEKA